MSARLPNSCFVHIPRTGGLWFKQVLESSSLKHQILKGDVDSHFTYRELPESWKRLYSFAFIRHPLAWVKSRWSHLMEHQMLDDYRHFGIHRAFDEMATDSFTTTIQNIILHSPGLVGETYSAMLDGVDQILKTENFPVNVCEMLTVVEDLSLEDQELFYRRPPINSTSRSSKWTGEFETTPPSLIKEFLESEQQSLKQWSNCDEK